MLFRQKPLARLGRSNLGGLLLLLLADANVQVGNDPADEEHDEESACESQWLPELGR
jgi:hypothetical protein